MKQKLLYRMADRPTYLPN